MMHLLQNAPVRGLQLWLIRISLLVFASAAQAQTWQPLGPDDFAATWPSTDQVDCTSLALDASGTPYVAYRDNITAKATVVKYDGSNWVVVGNPNFSPLGAYNTSLQLDANGTPYVAMYLLGQGAIVVMKYNGTSWETVGNTTISAGELDATLGFVLDTQGVPYVSFQDANSADKTTVMKYNGSSWVTVGSPGFSADVAFYQSLAFDAMGTLYIAYADALHDNKATVMKYNGSNWVLVGNPGFSAKFSYNIKIAANQSQGGIYVAYSDNTPQVAVMKYNGMSWVNVGVVCNPGGYVSDLSLVLDANGLPYIAYQDWDNAGETTVKRYNGSSWETVGNAGFASGIFLSLAFDAQGTPYIAFRDGDAEMRATVMKLHENNWVLVQKNNGTGWAGIGNTGFSDGTASPILSVDYQGVPYIYYIDPTENYKPTVMKYDGSNWVHVGSPGFSAGPVSGLSFALDPQGTPYVAYQLLDYPAAGGELVLMKYNGNSWETVSSLTNPSLQMYSSSLAFDTTGVPYLAYPDYSYSLNSKITVMKYSGNAWITVGSPGVSYEEGANTPSLIFDKNNMPYVAFYINGLSKLRIMKYDGTNWIPLGSPISGVPIDKFTFTLDGNNAAYIAYFDGYGHIAVKKHDGNDWVSLGLTLLTGTISSSPCVAVDDNGTVYVSYQDENSNKANVVYLNSNNWVAVGNTDFSADKADNLCLKIAGTKAYVTYSTTWAYAKVFDLTTAVDPLHEERTALSAWPNPANETIHLSASPGTAWSLCDLTGRLLLQGTLAGEDETLDIAPLPAGVYVLRAGNAQARVVKE